MKVAALELCKELDELSGWRTKETLVLNEDSKTEVVFQMYDLGFLIRKVPGDIDYGYDSTGNLELTFHAGLGVWSAWYQTEELPSCQSVSPEDAVAKLAIDLFKQSILIREVA